MARYKPSNWKDRGMTNECRADQEKTYLIGIDGRPERHTVQARNKKQAQYRLWRSAVEAGYRVSLLRFVTEWVEFVREVKP